MLLEILNWLAYSFTNSTVCISFFVGYILNVLDAIRLSKKINFIDKFWYKTFAMFTGRRKTNYLSDILTVSLPFK